MDIGQAFSDLQDLDASDLKKIGAAPAAVRVAVLAVLFAALVAAGFVFVVKPKFEQHDAIAAKEQSFKNSL